jgi:hypothetical protein
MKKVSAAMAMVLVVFLAVFAVDLSHGVSGAGPATTLNPDHASLITKGGETVPLSAMKDLSEVRRILIDPSLDAPKRIIFLINLIK